LQGNTQYSFKVRAVDAIQNLGTFSDPATVTTPLLDVFKPSRMTGLTAVRVDYETFDLSWDPGVDDQGIAGAAIEICLGDGCTEYKLQFVATFQTTIHVRGLASQLPYYFRGKHIDIAGNVSEEYSEPAKGVPFPLASGNVQGLCACQVP
jgi:predicted phage tail protein